MDVLWGMMEQIDRQRRSKMIDEAVDASTMNPALRYKARMMTWSSAFKQ